MPGEEITIPTSVTYYHDIDLGTNQLLNARLHPLSTAQRNALASSYNSQDEGIVVYDTTLDTFFVWDGNQWIQVGLTQTQIQQITDAYNKSVMSIDVTSTTTDRTITLNYRDTTFTADVYKYAHIHNQPAPSAEWTITHNLGKYPAVTVVDSTEAEVIGEVEYINDSSLRVKFSAAFSGKAFLN
jgi:hypothetical protein